MKKLILDLDTGVDDALAISYALGSPEVELIGITGTYGNVLVEQGVRNALAVTDLLGHPEVKVYRGLPHSSTTDSFSVLPVSAFIHGENGIGDVTIPDSKREVETESAVDFIIDAVKTYGKDLIYVPTGPMTNIQAALKKAPEIKDEDVDKRLEALRQRFGTLVGVDRPAAKGDFANIDLTAEIDGETVDSQEGVSYELGSNTMLDGLDEALDGLSAGEETTFEGTLEAGEHEGQKATVKVKVNSVKAEELPELNDEFASEASEFDTLDELKADIRKAAAQDAEGRQATEARDAFIAKLQEGLEIPVPKGVKANMVEEQLKGMTPDPEKATKEQKAQAEETVEKDLRDQMVLDALAEKLDVQVSQSDVFNFLASIAQQYGMDPNAFIQAIMRNGQLGSAVQEVARSKGLLAGMRAVKFTADGEVVDLSDFLGNAAEEEEEESVEAASAAAAVADELSAKDGE